MKTYTDRKVSCPYNKSHIVPEGSFLSHITFKCSDKVDMMNFLRIQPTKKGFSQYANTYPFKNRRKRNICLKRVPITLYISSKSFL